ncbi:YgaP family membrane protein [Undibacterium sp. TC4M20W]|uniref:YgaP family membrane protein n=1 Tax=unclassified Undibacterium TaxID=2630295 RepID=UPI003BF08763
MFHFKRNLPHWERALRIISGLLLFWLAYSGQVGGMLNWVIIASAVTMIMTAFVGFCPACAILANYNSRK